MSKPKTVIIHDWLVGGGAERVVEELHKLYPEAPIYTSYCSREWREKLNGKVITGWLQYWPFSWLRKYIGVLRMWWFSRLDLREFDLVIVSTGNGEAKFVRPAKSATYICYCHSPVHFLWRHYHEYQKNPGFSFGGFGLKLLANPLRKKDHKAAQRPDYFIANSTHIQRDIKKYYGRDSVVIHPPVDTERFAAIKAPTRSGFITVGRQVPYKHTDIIIKACAELNVPLMVVGDGPEHHRLEKLAGPGVTFDDRADNNKVAEYMASAEAFIFAAEEDFGITPVEALSAGTPVIAYKAGGALDYVTPGKTGQFFDQQTVTSLSTALQNFDPAVFDEKAIRQRTEQFDSAHFRNHLKNFIDESVG